MIFDYPAARTQRRHGPRGYTRHESYRPWLRDEFTFRCAYCLKRERWGQATGEFDIDHFLPSSLRPDLALDYENLMYACRRCNGVKQDQVVDDPFAVMCGGHIETRPDGTVHGRDDEARRMVLALDLNSPKLIEWRTVWMRSVELAQERAPDLLRQLIGFSPDLPDLRRLRPPAGNSRPGGLDECWIALAERNELPSSY